MKYRVPHQNLHRDNIFLTLIKIIKYYFFFFLRIVGLGIFILYKFFITNLLLKSTLCYINTNKKVEVILWALTFLKIMTVQFSVIIKFMILNRFSGSREINTHHPGQHNRAERVVSALLQYYLDASVLNSIIFL